MNAKVAGVSQRFAVLLSLSFFGLNYGHTAEPIISFDQKSGTFPQNQFREQPSLTGEEKAQIQLEAEAEVRAAARDFAKLLQVRAQLLADGDSPGAIDQRSAVLNDMRGCLAQANCAINKLPVRSIAWLKAHAITASGLFAFIASVQLHYGVPAAEILGTLGGVSLLSGVFGIPFAAFIKSASVDLQKDRRENYGDTNSKKMKTIFFDEIAKYTQIPKTHRDDWLIAQELPFDIPTSVYDNPKTLKSYTDTFRSWAEDVAAKLHGNAEVTALFKHLAANNYSGPADLIAGYRDAYAAVEQNHVLNQLESAHLLYPLAFHIEPVLSKPLLGNNRREIIDKYLVFADSRCNDIFNKLSDGFVGGGLIDFLYKGIREGHVAEVQVSLAEKTKQLHSTGEFQHTLTFTLTANNGVTREVAISFIDGEENLDKLLSRKNSLAKVNGVTQIAVTSAIQSALPFGNHLRISDGSCRDALEGNTPPANL